MTKETFCLRLKRGGLSPGPGLTNTIPRRLRFGAMGSCAAEQSLYQPNAPAPCPSTPLIQAQVPPKSPLYALKLLSAHGRSTEKPLPRCWGAGAQSPRARISARLQDGAGSGCLMLFPVELSQAAPARLLPSARADGRFSTSLPLAAEHER